MMTFRLIILLAILYFHERARGARCFCGLVGACSFDKHNQPLIENCTSCKNTSNGVYEDDCVTRIDYCASKPCKNNGKCVPVLGWFHCKCKPRFTGVYCTDANDPPMTRLSDPVVYFPLNMPPNVERLIWVGVRDFGDQFEAVVSFTWPTNGTTYVVDDYAFEQINVREQCLTDARMYADYVDVKICDLIPNEEINAISVAQHAIKSIKNAAFGQIIYGWRHEGQMLALANVEQVTITLKNGNLVLFQRTYNAPVKLTSLDSKCDPQVTFVSCSTNRDQPFIVQPLQALVIGAITRLEKDSCRPYKEVITKWYHIRPYALMREVTNVQSKMFPIARNWLSVDLHEFHFEFGLQADPPNYGSYKRTINYGKCWIQIVEGKPEISLVGGQKQRHPCNSPLTLVVKNLNPNYDPANFNFTWTCNSTKDPRCLPNHSRDKIHYPLSAIGCGSTYMFKVRASNPHTPEVAVAQTEITFDPKIEFSIVIICFSNCRLGADLGREVILKIKTFPFVPGAFDLNVTKDGDPNYPPKGSVKIRQTNKHPVIFISRKAAQVPGDVIVTVNRSSHSAVFKLTIRNRPAPAVCVTTPVTNHTFNVNCTSLPKDKVYSVFYLLNPQSHSQLTDSFAESFYGQFHNITFGFSPVMVYYVNFMGDWSVNYFEVQTYLDYDKFKRDLKNAWFLAREGNHVDLLRAITINTMLFKRNLGTYASPNTDVRLAQHMLHLAEAINKVELFQREDMTLSAGNSISRLLQIQTKVPVTATKVRWYCTKSLRKTASLVADIMNRDLNFLFRGGDPARNAHYLKLLVNLLEYQDPFIRAGEEKPVIPVTHSVERQRFKRISERSSVELLSVLDSLFLIDESELEFMGDPWSYASSAGSANHFGVMGTFNFIGLCLSNYSNYIDLNSYYYPNKDDVNQHELLFQMYSFNSEIFWWHRFIAIHSAIMKVKIIDLDTRQSIPPSTTDFPVTLTILPQYKLYWDLALMDQTILPNISSPKKDYYATIYAFDAPIMLSKIFFNFTKCEGCRAIVSYNRIPSYEDFQRDGKSSGDVSLTFYDMEFAKYYISVLPSEEAEREKPVTFILQYEFVSCMTWDDYKYIGNCELDHITKKESGNYSVTCRCNRMAWFAASIPKVPLKRVFVQIMNAEAIEEMNWKSSFMCALLLLFLVLVLVWCIYMDKADNNKKYLKIMTTSSPLREYEYIVGIFSSPTYLTTTSQIGLRLVGSSSTSAAGLVKFGFPMVKISRDDEWYSMASNAQIGRIEEIHLWHDHSGVSPSWKCEKVLVFDVNLNALYFFAVGKRLTVAPHNDCSVVTESANRVSNVYSFVETGWHYFVKNLRLEFANKHRILSLYFKSSRSVRSRIESWAICAVFISSIFSISLIIWSEETGDIDFDERTYPVGQSFRISLASLILAYVPTLVISELFWCYTYVGVKGSRLRSSVNFGRRRTYKSSSIKTSSFGSRSKSMAKSFQSSTGRSMTEEQFFQYLAAGRRMSKKTKRQRLTVFVERYERRVIRCLSRFIRPIFYKRVMHKKDSVQMATTSRLKRLRKAAWAVTIVIVSFNFIVMLVISALLPPHMTANWFQWAVLTIVADAVLVDPLKIFIFACILLYVVKKSDLEMNAAHFDPAQEMIPSKPCADYRAFIADRTRPCYKTMTWEKIEKIRKWNRRKKTIMFFLFNLCTIIPILCMSYSMFMCDIKLSYLTMESIKGIMVTRDLTIDQVASKKLVTDFILNNFMPHLNDHTWYNGRSSTNKQSSLRRDILFERNTYTMVKGSAFTHDLILVGPIRGRLHAIKKSQIIAPNFRNWFPISYGSMDYSIMRGWTNIQTKDVCEGWMPIEGCLPRSRIWKFSPPARFWMEKGKLGWVPTEGFLMTMDWSSQIASKKFMNLIIDQWIDNKTSSVIVDFNLYNINFNILVAGQLVFETPSSGVSTGFLSLETGRPARSSEFPKFPLTSSQYFHYRKRTSWENLKSDVWGLGLLVITSILLYSIKFISPFFKRLYSTTIPVFRVSLKLILAVYYFTMLTGAYVIEPIAIEVTSYSPFYPLIKAGLKFSLNKYISVLIVNFLVVFKLVFIQGFLISFYMNVSRQLRIKARRKKMIDDRDITEFEVFLDHVVSVHPASSRLKLLNLKFARLLF